MPDSPASEPAFVCDCEEQMRSACAGEPFYKELQGQRYCVLHFPSEEKSADFRKAFQRKIENRDFNFRGAWFPDEVSLARVDFSEPTDFTSATFNSPVHFRGAMFRSEASFHGATFNAHADFSYVSFRSRAEFGSATFIAIVNFSYSAFEAAAEFPLVTFGAEAYFRSVVFRSRADFTAASFRLEGDFSETSFRSKARFTQAIFGNYMNFSGNEYGGFLDLQYARVENPEHISFRTVALRSVWFINVDVRKFNFINVDWIGDVSQDASVLRERRVSAPHALLATTYRNLAINAEESNRPEEASRFRYMALESRRKATWHGFAFWKLGWWYWITSGYGERPGRALMLLVYTCFIFGLFYTQVGFARWKPSPANSDDAAKVEFDRVGAHLRLGQALTYSLSVMSFQKPDDPRPATSSGQMLIVLQTILSTLLVGRTAAAIALAARRERLDS
jgi:hypothetical protein